MALPVHNVTATGWFTGPVAALQGEVPSGSIIKLGAYTTQNDIKNTWADGSLKYAIATCKPTATGTMTPTVITNPGGTITPTWPTVTVTFVVSAGAGSGSTYVATLPSYVGTDKWLNGALVNEARTRLTPVKTGPVDHDNLRVLADIRVYNDGASRVDLTIENCRDNANMDSSTYTVTIAIGGSTVFTQSGLVQWAFTCWRKVFTTGGLTEATVTRDYAPFFAAKLFPEIQSTIATSDFTADSRYGNALYFGPLRFGFMTPKMGDVGGRPDFTPLPGWVVQYLKEQTPAQFEVLKRHGEYTGSWSRSRIYKTDASTMYLTTDVSEPAKLNPYDPALGFTYPVVMRAPVVTSPRTMFRGARDANGPGDGVTYPTNEETPILNWEHVPDVVWPAYIATGDRFYVDQMKQWANIWIMQTEETYTLEGVAVGRRDGVHLYSMAQYAGPRGLTRSLRTVVGCAHSLPDADTHRSYFIAAANDNFLWMSEYHTIRTPTGNVFHDVGLFWEGDSSNYMYDDPALTTVVSSQIHFQIWAGVELAELTQRARYVGILTVPDGALALIDRILKWYVATLASGSDAVYHRAWTLGAFYPSIGSRAGPIGSTVTYASSLADQQTRSAQYNISLNTPISATCTCSDSLTITVSGMTATSSWIGHPVGIGGRSGSNWLDKVYDTTGVTPIGVHGVFWVTAVPSGTQLTLDRKPVTGGTSAINGHVLTFNMPPGVIGYNGVHADMATNLAIARGLTDAAAAKAYVAAYSSGGIQTELNTTNTGYALAIPADVVGGGGGSSIRARIGGLV